MPNNKFTEEQIRDAVRASYSIADVCRELGLIPAGGNYRSMKQRISRYDIDVSHFKGQSWRKEEYSDTPNLKISIKKKLIRERGHQCQNCKNKTWFEVPITLELEHVDGNNSNNSEENLLLLCPNCHAQTKTWRRPKSSFKENPKLICPMCNGPKNYGVKSCGKCFNTKRAEHRDI